MLIEILIGVTVLVIVAVAAVVSLRPERGES